RVRSNKNFNVFVKSNAANFTYTGGAIPAPVMPVTGVLNLLVVSDATGGIVPAPYSTVAFAPIWDFDVELIQGGQAGADQKFTVQYKATPGFTYPAGTYDVGVVYTATQQ